MSYTVLGPLGLPQQPYGNFVSYDVTATTPNIALAAVATSINAGDIIRDRFTTLGPLGLPQAQYDFTGDPDHYVTVTTASIALAPVSTTVEHAADTNVNQVHATTGLQIIRDSDFDDEFRWFDNVLTGTAVWSGSRLTLTGFTGTVQPTTASLENWSFGDTHVYELVIDSYTPNSASSIAGIKFCTAQNYVWSGDDGAGSFRGEYIADADNTNNSPVIVVLADAVDMVIDFMGVHETAKDITLAGSTTAVGSTLDIVVTTANVALAAVDVETDNVGLKRYSTLGPHGLPQMRYELPFIKSGVNVSATIPDIALAGVLASVEAVESLNVTVLDTPGIAVAVDLPSVRTNEPVSSWFNDSWWSAPFWRNRVTGQGWWRSLSSVIVTTPNITLAPVDVGVLTAADIRPNTPNITIAPVDADIEALIAPTANTANITLAPINVVVSKTPHTMIATTPDISLAAYQVGVIQAVFANATTDAIVLASVNTTVNAAVNITVTTPDIVLNAVDTSVNGSVPVDVQNTPDITVAPVDVGVNTATNPTATTPDIALAPVDVTVNAGNDIDVINTANITVVGVLADITASTEVTVTVLNVPDIAVAANDVDLEYNSRFGIIVQDERGYSGSIVSGE